MQVKFNWRTVFAVAVINLQLTTGVGFCSVGTEAIRARTYMDLDFDWRFSNGDFPTAYSFRFDDSSWRMVNVPHDWSIEGPFGPQYASGTGYSPGGIGWYRKHFRLDSSLKGKHVTVEFDGVYCNSEVWINGQFVGRRPYGYSSFQYDLTPHVRFGNEDNLLTVRVDHSKVADSRWYTGSGIYRHVRLCITDKLHIAHWGTFVTTPEVRDEQATVKVQTEIENTYERDKTFTLKLDILATDGRVVASRTHSGTIQSKARETVVSNLTVENPQRWSIKSPTLYQLKSVIQVNSQAVDESVTTFGIRTLTFDPDNGFFLNDQSVKLKGVCIHHDAGCLGAAVPNKVLERRLRLLKELGCNAIRTSHNPPAPELLDICDSIGLLVQDEAFDEFTPPKNKWVDGRNVGIPARFGYGEYFDVWAVRDMQDLVRRDRNHPCVIMWSIGNEVDFANDPFSHPVLGWGYRPYYPPAENLVTYGTRLVKAVKEADSTRPVTAGLANMRMSNAVAFPEVLDVVGYNYRESRYEADHRTYPKRFIYGSENGDGYDAWLAVRDNKYVAGQFLWTGIDYLGEAGRWPSRVFGGGVFDLAMFKKPIGWWRQSLWSDEPMVYVCVSPGQEHWNFSSGSTLELLCATNCTEVLLKLNGRELDTMKRSEAKEGWLRLKVSYEPGILQAIGRDGHKILCEFTLRTAQAPKRIKLVSDTVDLKADGKDICHIEFYIVDENDIRVPDASNEVTFIVAGPGQVIGIDNGRRDGAVDYKDLRHEAFMGRGLAIVQSERTAGTLTIKATSPGLEPATITLSVH